MLIVSINMCLHSSETLQTYQWAILRLLGKKTPFMRTMWNFNFQCMSKNYVAVAVKSIMLVYYHIIRPLNFFVLHDSLRQCCSETFIRFSPLVTLSLLCPIQGQSSMSNTKMTRWRKAGSFQIMCHTVNSLCDNPCNEISCSKQSLY